METFYIALISGFLPLLGVALTLWHNRKLQRDRIAIEESRRSQDREFLNKREALIRAFEAVLRFINYFMTLPDRDLPKDGKTDEEISELGIALYGLHFYCDVKTIEYSTRLGKTLTLALSEVMKAKMASAFLKEDIKNNLLQIDEIEKQIKISQEEIRALLYSNPQSPVIANLKGKIAERYPLYLICMAVDPSFTSSSGKKLKNVEMSLFRKHERSMSRYEMFYFSHGPS